MLKENLTILRNINGYSQEKVAEYLGISRQAYAKWESGASVPDVEKCAMLANMYDITIDKMLNFDVCKENVTMLSAPRGKHIFGTVILNESGNIPLPKEVLKIMNFSVGERLLVLGDEKEGLAIVKAEEFEAGLRNSLEMAKKVIE